MNAPVWPYAVLALLLVAVNAFFVAAEFAIVKVRATRLAELAAAGSRRAAVARVAAEHLDSYLSATQLGITFASLGLGWVGEPAFASIVRPLLAALGVWSPAVVHSVALSAAFVFITFIHIVLGELVPKSIAVQRTDSVTLWVSLPLAAFHRLFAPALWFLNASSNLVLRLFRVQPAGPAELAHSEEELRLLMAQSRRSGRLSGAKGAMLEKVLDYSTRSARNIMVPRAEIAYLSLNRPMKENREILRTSGHTRFPLCKEDVDDVIGLIHIKDLVRLPRQPENPHDLLPLKRQILFVPESRRLDLLQRDFQRAKVHMAIVVDEYGGTSGLVTLEDVIEEIVGEIEDEFDREGPKIERTADGYLIDGLVLVDELTSTLGVAFEDGETSTIGGYMLERLGRMPQPGDQITLPSGTLKVVQVKGRRVSKLLLSTQ